MTQTEMMSAIAVTTVFTRLTQTKLTPTITERVMPALSTLMVTVSEFFKSQLIFYARYKVQKNNKYIFTQQVF